MPTAASRRLVLVPAGRRSAAASADAALRRYRLARLRVEEPPPRRRDPGRFAHLKRTYD